MSCLVQSNADASLLSGAINPTTVRQGIFGFNGRNLLQSVKVGADLQKPYTVHMLPSLLAPANEVASVPESCKATAGTSSMRHIS